MLCCTFSDTVSQAVLQQASCVTTFSLMWFFCGCNCSSSQSEHYTSKASLMIADPSLLSYLLQHISKASPMKSGKRKGTKRKSEEERKDSRSRIPV